MPRAVAAAIMLTPCALILALHGSQGLSSVSSNLCLLQEQYFMADLSF
jgi:hypothetical protein